MNRLRKFLDKKHADYIEAHADFADIFQRLRRPEHIIDHKVAYDNMIEDVYLEQKPFIIRCLQRKVNFGEEYGHVTKLIVLNPHKQRCFEHLYTSNQHLS